MAACCRSHEVSGFLFPLNVARFGTVFTDHMLHVEYVEGQGGWGAPAIKPFGPLQLHPAAQVWCCYGAVPRCYGCLSCEGG